MHGSSPVRILFLWCSRLRSWSSWLRFWPALRTTLLLIILIIPAQFVLAIIMALVIQADLKGSGIFLYIFAIALGASDLAVGIVWYSIFTQLGYLNSILQGLGLIDAPLAKFAESLFHALR